MQSTAAIDESPRWAEALAGIGLDENSRAPAPDLALFFATPGYSEAERLVAETYQRSGASVLFGCSGGGIIGTGREIEGRRAVSILNLSLPGTQLHPMYVEMEDLAALRTPEDWRRWAALPGPVNAWIVFADPFSFDSEQLIEGLSTAYPGATVAGGLASGMGDQRDTLLFLNGQVYESGAVLLGLTGAYTVDSVVAQGAAPIGQPWTVTEVQRNVLRTIGNRPALDVLRQTLSELSEDTRARAARNLLVGLAMNEYREHLEQGDFLIRNLVGVDPDSGAIAIGAVPQVGQTIQFQVRDAAAADQDLHRRLAVAQQRVSQLEVAGGLLCTCNGRGVGLFGSSDHDARAVFEALGPIPLAGFFCNGEIGPVGGRTYLHGFTASLALFVPSKGEEP